MSSVISAIIWKWGHVADLREYDDGSYEIRSWRTNVPRPSAAEIAQAVVEHDAFLAARAYRDRRAAAYAGFVNDINGLGAEPGLITTVGDVLDDVIGQVEANRVAAGADMTADFATLLSRRAAIKAAFPKPE